MKCRAFPLLVFAAISVEASAAPLVQSLSITIDKPNYSWAYSVGVEAYVELHGSEFADVTASHINDASGSVGTWPLERTGSSWWAWAPTWMPQVQGPLGGTIEVAARDSEGEIGSISVALQPSEEMDLPAFSASWNGHHLSVDGDAVDRADWYNLWLWDPVDRFYPVTQQVFDPDEVLDISAAQLTNGRQYNLYWMANNLVQLEQEGSSILYRSYSMQYVTAPVSALPEPGTAALALIGLFVGSAARSTPRGRGLRQAMESKERALFS